MRGGGIDHILTDSCVLPYLPEQREYGEDSLPLGRQDVIYPLVKGAKL